MAFCTPFQRGKRERRADTQIQDTAFVCGNVGGGGDKRLKNFLPEKSSKSRNAKTLLHKVALCESTSSSHWDLFSRAEPSFGEMEKERERERERVSGSGHRHAASHLTQSAVLLTYLP